MVSTTSAILEFTYSKYLHNFESSKYALLNSNDFDYAAHSILLCKLKIIFI